MKANLKVVISNHRDLEHIAQFFGIPFVCIAQTGVPEEDCKPRMEAAIETVLQQHDVELIVLARCDTTCTAGPCATTMLTVRIATS